MAMCSSIYKKMYTILTCVNYDTHTSNTLEGIKHNIKKKQNPKRKDNRLINFKINSFSSLYFILWSEVCSSLNKDFFCSIKYKTKFRMENWENFSDGVFNTQNIDLLTSIGCCWKIKFRQKWMDAVCDFNDTVRKLFSKCKNIPHSLSPTTFRSKLIHSLSKYRQSLCVRKIKS